ncbi:MAG TPA: DUF2267 domain-containing protein [Anaeromyxobacteraceae bacterium]|nr:DUF2267 domain-containing protein [Anaeromyxobacteraceae bacterium]
MAEDRRDPGAPQVTHARDLFVEAVARAGLPEGLDPAHAARGAVCTLARRVDAADARALLDALPVAIRDLVACEHRERDDAEPWSRAEFVGRLAEHVGADALQAERIARVVFAALQRHVPPETVAAFGEALPSDLEELWRHPETGLADSGAPAA